MSTKSRRKARRRGRRSAEARRAALVGGAIPTPQYVLHHDTRGINESGGRHVPETNPGHRMVDSRVVAGEDRFLVNERLVIDGGPGVRLPASSCIGALVWANRAAHTAWSTKCVLPGSASEVSIFDAMMSDLKAVSSAMGALFVRGLVSYPDAGLTLNPKQSGNPDILPTPVYERMMAAERAGEKPDWNRVSHGIEAKGTCGTVAEPELSYPYDATRVGMLKSFNFSAHHNENRCLLGVLWDHVAGVPQIVGAFYGKGFGQGDFTKTKRRKLGSRSTNSCSLTRSGLDKLRYVCVLNDARYIGAVANRLPECGL